MNIFKPKIQRRNNVRNLFENSESSLLNPKDVAFWASSYLGKNVTTNNIVYLINYGKIANLSNLTWIGALATKKPNSNINSLIAIPHNPYEPKSYERWTMAGILD